MKNQLILFAAFLMALSTLIGSCGTKDDTGSPVLDGKWTKTFAVSGSSYSGTLDIVQNSSNALSGTFVFGDGSGNTPLLSTSKVSGNSVTIEWMLTTYKMTFTGTIGSDFKTMNGSYTVSGTSVTGSWSATKNTKKSAAVKGDISQAESFLKLLSN